MDLQHPQFHDVTVHVDGDASEWLAAGWINKDGAQETVSETNADTIESGNALDDQSTPVATDSNGPARP